MVSVAESWDKLRWLVREGKEFSHDEIPLSKGEWTVLTVLKSVASPSKVFVDIGAHVGAYTVRMAKLCGKVYAVEPNPLSVEALKANLLLNGVANVEILQFAAGEEHAEMDLNVREASSTLLPVPGWKDKVKVSIKRLDDIVPRADIIKIDVEGWEEKVLSGAERILKECKPYLLIEHHEFRGYIELVNARQRIRSRLEGNYYSFYVDGVHWMYAPKGSDLSKISCLVTKYWFDKVINSIQNGFTWYHGLPGKWWWGMHPFDFIMELPNHLSTEPEWTMEAASTYDGNMQNL